MKSRAHYYAKSVVRESKFRQVVVESPGAAANYPEIVASEAAVGAGELITASVDYVALASSPTGAEITVVAVADAGKKYVDRETRILAGHVGGPVLDLHASFIEPQIIASGGSEGAAKIWRLPPAPHGANRPPLEKTVAIPEPIRITTPDQTLEPGTGRTVQQVRWHPTVAQTLLTACGPAVHVWDVEAGKPGATHSFESGDVGSVAWTSTGDRIAAACAGDKTIRVIDPRAPSSGTKFKEAHTGNKAVVLEWAGRSPDAFFSCGMASGSRADREVALWDVRFPDEPIIRTRVDQNTGALRPMYDADTSLLMVSGHGDVNVRVFEVDLASDEPFHAIGNFPAKIPEGSRSVCLLPKPCLDVMDCEVVRVLRLLKHAVEAVKVEVPRRKAYRDFQADLFPDTRAPQPSAPTSAIYFTPNDDGSLNNPLPLTGSVQTLAATFSTSERTIMRAEEHETQVADERAANAEADAAEAARLAERHENLESRFSKFLGYQAKMKYAKVTQATRNEQSYFNLTPEVGGVDYVAAVNSRFFAVPWKTGGGGAVYVGDLLKPGKLASPVDAPVLNAHAQAVNAVAFDNFDELRMVTASDDCTVRAWRLPAHGIQNNLDAGSAVGKSQKMEGGHRLAVRGVAMHHLAKDVVASFAMDATVKVWDLAKATCGLEVTLPEGGSAFNVEWSYDGSLLATSGRDSEVRIYDVRASPSAPTVSFRAHDGLKGMRVAYLGNSGGLVTTGFGKTGDREFRVWDERNLGSFLTSTKLDAGAGIPIPTFVEDNGVLLLTAKGENTIRIYELEGLSMSQVEVDVASVPGAAAGKKKEVQKFAVHVCSEYRCTGDPTTGLAFLPRRACNVYNTEWLRGIRVTATAVEAISFTVPRAADISSYFMDDLFPPARAGEPSCASAEEWLSGSGGLEAKRVDLNTKKAKPLSQRPVQESQASVKRAIANTDRMRKELEEEERRKKEKDAAMERMERLARQHEVAHPNLSKPGMGGHDDARDGASAGGGGAQEVADEEWGD